MTKEQIEELLEIFESQDEERLLNFLNLTNIESVEKVFENIMIRIEDSEQCDYFLNKLKDDNFTARHMIINIISYSKKDENKKKLIENSESYKLDTEELIDIIVSLKSTKDIEEYLMPEKIKELGLKYDNIRRLIEATGKIEEYLVPEKIKEFGLNNYNIRRLIEATGNIEKYLFEGQDVNDFDLTLEQFGED